MTSFWQYKVYAHIRGGSLKRGVSNDTEASETATFSAFTDYIFGTFRDKVNNIIWRYGSPVGCADPTTGELE